MELDNFVIEITRKCNLACAHCLRGTAQCKDMNPEILRQFLTDNDITYISTVSFTGGEPTLNLPFFDDFINICNELDVGVGSFYIVVNGVKVPDEFIITVAKLYAFCDDNEISQVQVSQSEYYLNQDDREISKLKCFKFFERRTTSEKKYLIREGNAETLLSGTHYGRRADIEGACKEFIDEWDDEDNDRIYGTVYLNCNGDILPDCDLSYDSQNNYSLGNVDDVTLVEIIGQLKEKYGEDG